MTDSIDVRRYIRDITPLLETPLAFAHALDQMVVHVDYE